VLPAIKCPSHRMCQSILADPIEQGDGATKLGTDTHDVLEHVKLLDSTGIMCHGLRHDEASWAEETIADHS
jgi:hypothetical protein